MHKIRPTRILRGAKNALAHNLGGEKPKEVVDRLSACNPCKNLTKIRSCALCGCQVDAKAEERLEYCPINQWKDIVIIASLGLAIKNNSPELVEITLIDQLVILTFKAPQEVGKPTTINLELINDRVNFFDSQLELKNIKVVTSCSCTTPTQPAESLEDGESTTFSITYNNKHKIEFSKTSTLKTGVGNIYIKLKGVTI